MRGLVACLIAVSAGALAQDDAAPVEPAPTAAVADPTAQVPGAAGWDGRLPGLPETPYPYAAGDAHVGPAGGGLTLFIDNSLHLYGDARRRDRDHDRRYDFGPYDAAGCSPVRDDGRGRGRTAGVIRGGTFGSVTRCADGYPGLPLRYGDSLR